MGVDPKVNTKSLLWFYSRRIGESYLIAGRRRISTPASQYRTSMISGIGIGHSLDLPVIL